MWMLGPLGFTSPLVLTALVALPLLWVLLRAVPPAPIRRRFPGVALLLGLQDKDTETERTPLWLLLLRAAALAAAIIGFAGPVLNPARQEAASDAPLLIVMDAGWADARDWPRRVDRALAVAEAAGRAGRTVALARLTDPPQTPVFQAAQPLLARLGAARPEPYAPQDLAGWAAALPGDAFDSYWISDGLDHPGRDALLDALQARGAVRVFETPRPVLALRPVGFKDGAVQITALRQPAGAQAEIAVAARGLDPAGIERELARATLTFATGQTSADTALALPPELRNRLTRFEISETRTAGAVTLTDDSLKRRKVALIGGGAGKEGLLLLSPTHYLRQALAPVAELIDGNLTDVLLANPDVIVLTDVARLTGEESNGLLKWAEGGGLLLRFAGPKLAASDIARSEEDPLLPVRLREGGRSLGGAMSWGDPRTLAPFPEGSPFFGLPVPGEVMIKAQVLAQPDPAWRNAPSPCWRMARPWSRARRSGRGRWCCSMSPPMRNGRRCRCRACSCRCWSGWRCPPVRRCPMRPISRARPSRPIRCWMPMASRRNRRACPASRARNWPGRRRGRAVCRGFMPATTGASR